MNQGGLFTRDYLGEGIRDTAAWNAVSDAEISALAADLADIFAAFPVDKSPSETRTEDDLIWKTLPRLGWNAWVRQQALAAKGRENVPDGLLFADHDAKSRADKRVSFEKYEEGLCLVESKKWLRPLDRPGKSKDESEVPSSQMLRYLRRAEDLTGDKLRWGILTNGKLWRLYYRGAKSLAEGFCELDLPAILGLAGHTDLTTPPTPIERAHWLKVFALIFRRESFTPLDGDTRSFHQISLEEGRRYEERVAKNLSRIVFETVLPALARGIAAHDRQAPKLLGSAYLSQVKEGALILLYRLLFVLYAEDRNLLPVLDRRYDDYGLRKRVRDDVARRIDENDVLASELSNYWDHARRLFGAIAKGASSIGLPPYNGGLFDADETPILERVSLPDAVFAPVIDSLCRLDRRYINYRDLSVQQLGSIYEKFLEYDVVAGKAGLEIALNPFARKGSGSYYTPDELVRLIIERTVGPLVKERNDAFAAGAKNLKGADLAAKLEKLDPATALLDLKVCDPAMGSGHFLVDLVDYLSDAVLLATVTASEAAEGYVSPLVARIAAIRAQILKHAKANNWAVREEQLDDKLIVRRMVLKRVIYGVDKNPMAVELAKVALWLHTFTVGAPLSFLDHHLRCGDSLFGETVRGVMDRLAKRGAMLLHPAIQQARAAIKGMESIELNTNADIAGVKNSAATFEGVREATAPLSSFMSLLHAFAWLDPKEKEDRKAIDEWLDGNFGEPFEIAQGRLEPRGAAAEQTSFLPKAKQAELMKGATGKQEVAQRFAKLLGGARRLVAEEHFHHWQIAYPGVWAEWESNEPLGGFDAVIGNPPWDRIKFQEVEWFAARQPVIAHADTAARRKSLIEKLKRDGDPLAAQYDAAAARADAMARMARDCGAFPLLSGGDINIYSLFVERALSLVKPAGLVGLLTPSGIASDKTASAFFRSISTTGRLAVLFDFENRRPPLESFFPDVDSRFKFCVLVTGGPKREFAKADCAFFLRAAKETKDPEKAFTLGADDFRLVNPNTGTAPIFRSRRDAELTTAIYSRAPVLVDRSGQQPKAVWPVKYFTMFHMTNDSGLFRTKADLEKLGAYPVGGNRWKRGKEEFVPLYEGKMVQAYDHRAASVEVDTTRLHRPGQPLEATGEQHANPKWLPDPQFWVSESNINLQDGTNWLLGFKEITAPTNMRTMIASLIPRSGVGNTYPLLLSDDAQHASTILSCFNSLCFDYAARQKVQGQHLNWFIVEQLPVIPLATYARKFGPKTAAEIVKRDVLALTYTAHDMEPFARDIGYDGPPFAWDEMDRLKRRARLDALYFLLYGVTDRDDVRYIYSTFPIVAREETAAHGRYLSRDYCLMYMNALEAGDPDAAVEL